MICNFYYDTNHYHLVRLYDVPESRTYTRRPINTDTFMVGYNLVEGVYFTTIASKYDINNGIPTVIAFLHVQTTYVHSLIKYHETYTTIQHATEHISLTQLGIKAGIKLWGGKV